MQLHLEGEILTGVVCLGACCKARHDLRCQHQLLESGSVKHVRIWEDLYGEELEVVEVRQGLREHTLAAEELGSAGQESQGSSRIE